MPNVSELPPMGAGSPGRHPGSVRTKEDRSSRTMPRNTPATVVPDAETDGRALVFQEFAEDGLPSIGSRALTRRGVSRTASGDRRLR